MLVTLLSKKFWMLKFRTFYFGRLIFGLNFLYFVQFSDKISDTVIKILKNADFSLRHAKWIFLAQKRTKAKTQAVETTHFIMTKNIATSNVFNQTIFQLVVEFKDSFQWRLPHVYAKSSNGSSGSTYWQQQHPWCLPTRSLSWSNQVVTYMVKKTNKPCSEHVLASSQTAWCWYQ